RCAQNRPSCGSARSLGRRSFATAAIALYPPKAFVKGLRPVAHCVLMSVAGRATPAGVVIPSRFYRYRNSGAQPVIGEVSDEENTESAPPSSDMNSRRFMSDMGACSPRFVPTKAMAVLLVCRPSRVSRSGWQVLGQHLKCSESRGVGKEFRFHLPRAKRRVAPIITLTPTRPLDCCCI